VTQLRSYPSDLAAHVRTNWPVDAHPLPRQLEALLDTAYHASFLRDEERPVTCRLIVLPPEELAGNRSPPTGLLPLEFEEPRAFDDHELRRLSPAAEYSRALVGVTETRDDIVTWGLVQSGPRWLQAAHGGRAAEPPIPRCLVVRLTRPGHLAVSCGNELVGELRGGRLTDFTLDVFESQWLPARLPFEDSFTKHVAQQMVKRVVAILSSAHHGGTILLAPADALDERFLSMKYRFRENARSRRFRALVGEMMSALEVHSQRQGVSADSQLYRSVVDPRIAELDEALFELSHLIAALADVDGAVVLSKKLDVLGFGGEIAGELPQIREVRRALDLEGDKYVIESLEGTGTRHRSAYRFCAACPKALAVVVSQDGDVRFATFQSGAVTYWNHNSDD
jgi:hypothetical protein